MSAPRRLLSAKEVSALLGHEPTARSDGTLCPQWFYNHRRNLERLGFPKPVPGVGKRWDPVAIEAWLAQWRAETGETRVTVPHDWATRLDERAFALGGKGH